MADPIKVDSHVHLYRSLEEGILEKDGYQVWEYGTRENTHESNAKGTVTEILKAMEHAEVAKAIVVNLFIVREREQKRISKLLPGLSAAERNKAVREARREVLEDFCDFNRWACETAREHSQLVPFIGIDLHAFSGERAAAHVRDMVENHAAKGVKLHGAAQGYNMSDERLWPMYAACQELSVPIIAHSGPDRGGEGFAEPQAFGRMLRAFPTLTVVLAHMGGATWEQASEIAHTYPNAFFDCCEIIEWTGGSKAPTEQELTRLIKDVGPERVMMGSDFPWYDLDHTVGRVMELPLLSVEEKEGILGANAVRILAL